MITQIEGDKVTLDGRITITKTSAGEYFIQSPDASVQVEAGNIHDKTVTPPQPKYDPKTYKDWTKNGLTVEESTHKAVDRIFYEIWGEFGNTEIDAGKTSLFDPVRQLIVDGKGRDTAYAIAGGIKRGYKEGKYKGVPLTYIFKGIVEGEIKTPEKVSNPPVWNAYPTKLGRYA